MADSLTVKLRLHLGPGFHSSAVIPLAPQSFEVVELRVAVEMAREAPDSGVLSTTMESFLNLITNKTITTFARFIWKM